MNNQASDAKSAEEIIGDGLFSDQVGSNIKVVSWREAMLAMHEYADQQLKQERNKAIDEAIELFKARGFNPEDYNGNIAFEILENLKNK